MGLNVPNFAPVRVGVAGDVMLDEYWFGGAQRLSPEAPVPVVHLNADEGRPGGAANVAINLAALGCQTTLLGVVGADSAADQLRGLIEAAGVTTSLLVDADKPTITKLRVMARGQQLIRLDREETRSVDGPSLAGALATCIADLDVLVLSDYAKGALFDVEALIEIARQHDTAVVIDPKGTDFNRYRGATLLTPNQGEFEAVVGLCANDDELVERGMQLLETLGLHALLVTRSERGMLLLSVDEAPLFLSTEAREVFDVTGAGDTVIATLAASLGAGLPMSAAAAFANLAAGLVVRKTGVAHVSPGELRVALHRRGTGGRGLVDLTELQELVADSRARSERVVMTNGCFDILHAGHVGYLEEAKALGDRLIVAVNDDDSVQRLKGADRPINGLEDRMAVLAGLAAVDWVVPFSADTPAALIEAVLPDVLVKGGDYAVSDIVGGAAVLEAGGEVRVLRFREGRSSTRIIDAIRKT